MFCFSLIALLWCCCAEVSGKIYKILSQTIKSKKSNNNRSIYFCSKIPMTNLQYLKPITWIFASAIGLCTFIINGLIFKKEWKKRKSKEINFTYIYLQIFSLITIVSGVLDGLFISIASINIFCHFSYQMVYIFSGIQTLFMRFYQLSRLFYCFSSKKILKKNDIQIGYLL